MLLWGLLPEGAVRVGDRCESVGLCLRGGPCSRSRGVEGTQRAGGQRRECLQARERSGQLRVATDPSNGVEVCYESDSSLLSAFRLSRFYSIYSYSNEIWKY